MWKFTVVMMSLLASVVVASQELWVVYHTGCARCDAFLNEVVASYPDASLMNDQAVLPIKLLNASIPLHQEVIVKIQPPVMSTPTFLIVEKSASSAAPQVLDRWVGYKTKLGFYQRLTDKNAPASS